MMAVPPVANGGFPGYDYYPCNYQMPVAAAVVAQPFNSSHLNIAAATRNDSDNREREKYRNRERRDSQSSRDRDHKSMFGSQVDHDKPPFSRVFVVCSKYHSSDVLKSAFSEYGTVEDVWVVKDKQTKENRGVAYVKFSKMSEACLAVESMDGKKLTDAEDTKPLKVIIAQPKSSKSTEDFNDESALTRLFVVIPKGMDEKDLRQAFEEFGEIEYVQVVKDRKTGDKKGFGYVKYKRAYNAAVAVESCDKSYRAVMAEPKSVKIKRDLAQTDIIQSSGHFGVMGNSLEMPLGLSGSSNRVDVPSTIPAGFGINFQETRSSAIGNRLQVQVAVTVSQEQLARLFDLIPGLELCDLKKNYSTGESKGVAVVVYNSVGSAIYAKEKLNGFEYPPGYKLIVRYAPDEVDGNIATMRSSQLDLSLPTQQINTGITYCTAQLPSAQPLSDSESCAERLFIVCQPSPPPDNVLKDVFCRFGDLIDVFMLRNKNFGYAKYASVESAERAIRILHGTEVLGKKLKVLQAEPPKSSAESARKRPRT